jgi:hypothetical protein
MRWYLNRLSQMSAPELAHRLVRVAEVSAESLGYRLAMRVPAPQAGISSRNWILGVQGIRPEPYLAAADELLQGRERIFALSVEPAAGRARDWNRDPLTGISAPMKLGKRIDYRDERLVGNIKYLWEPNRHLDLVTLAQAYALKRGAAHLAGVREWLESWLDQCPYPQGINWASSLEVAIRLINWSLTWQLVGGEESELFAGDDGRRFRQRWLESIYRHVFFIDRFYSRYSSANNHLIGEASAVFVAAQTWPCWDDLQTWGEKARGLLCEQIELQTHDDGVNKEKAVSYQQFVLDFFILAALAGRGAGSAMPERYWQSVERMLEFIYAIMDCKGNVPSFGDADDGYVTRLSREPGFMPFSSLLATGAVLFGRGDFAAKSGHLDDKTRMLVGEGEWRTLAGTGRAGASRPRLVFPEGGYFVLGRDLETEREVRAVIGAGPLGYLSIAAHGHADALSLVLSIAGREMLVDPGTYSYHTNPEWRRYFRGTAAHNTVQVDGADQSIQGGNFMWMRHAHARCTHLASVHSHEEFVGEHDGYLRLADPVLHRRSVRLEEGRIVVEDQLTCAGAHDVERHWHFSERCDAAVLGGAVAVNNGPVQLTLRSMSLTTNLALLTGSSVPIAGWISRAFDMKQPATTATFRDRIYGTATLTTILEWKIAAEQGADPHA